MLKLDDSDLVAVAFKNNQLEMVKFLVYQGLIVDLKYIIIPWVN